MKEPAINTIFLLSTIGLIIVMTLLGCDIKVALAAETKKWKGETWTLQQTKGNIRAKSEAKKLYINGKKVKLKYKEYDADNDRYKKYDADIEEELNWVTYVKPVKPKDSYYVAPIITDSPDTPAE